MYFIPLQLHMKYVGRQMGNAKELHMWNLYVASNVNIG
jgi:hypothetical protein